MVRADTWLQVWFVSALCDITEGPFPKQAVFYEKTFLLTIVKLVSLGNQQLQSRCFTDGFAPLSCYFFKSHTHGQTSNFTQTLNKLQTETPLCFRHV